MIGSYIYTMTLDRVREFTNEPLATNIEHSASAEIAAVKDIHAKLTVFSKPIDRLSIDTSDVRLYTELSKDRQVLYNKLLILEEEISSGGDWDDAQQRNYEALKEEVSKRDVNIAKLAQKYDIPVNALLLNSIDYIGMILSADSLEKQETYRAFAMHVIHPKKTTDASDDQLFGNLTFLVAFLGKNNPPIQERLVALDSVSKGAGLSLLTAKKEYFSKLLQYRSPIPEEFQKTIETELDEMIAFLKNVRVPDLQFFDKYGLEIFEYPRALGVNRDKSDLQEKLRQDYVSLCRTMEKTKGAMDPSSEAHQEIVRRREIIKNFQTLENGNQKRAEIVKSLIEHGQGKETFEYLDETGKLKARVEVEYQKVEVGAVDMGGLSHDISPGDRLQRITKLSLLPIPPATEVIDVLQEFNCKEKLPVFCSTNENVSAKNSRSTGIVYSRFPDNPFDFAVLVHELGHFKQASDPDLLPYLGLKGGKLLKLWTQDKEFLFQDLSDLPPHSRETNDLYRVVTRVMERDATARALYFFIKARTKNGTDLISPKFKKIPKQTSDCTDSVTEGMAALSIPEDLNNSLATYEATTLEMKKKYDKIPHIPSMQKDRLKSLEALNSI